MGEDENELGEIVARLRAGGHGKCLSAVIKAWSEAKKARVSDDDDAAVARIALIIDEVRRRPDARKETGK